jgi:hypothetical protein
MVNLFGGFEKLFHFFVLAIRIVLDGRNLVSDG